MDKTLMDEFVKNVFGTSDEAIIGTKKTEEQQTRAAINKPEPIKMTAAACEKLCTKVGLAYLEGYEARILEYTITNEAVDRYGDIVRAAGVLTANYVKNPIMLFAHDSRSFPIGYTVKLWHDKTANAIKAWGLFYDDRVDKFGVADTAFRFAVSGGMKGCSIGFMPLDYRIPSKEDRTSWGMPDYGWEYTKSDLLEWSPCAVPANPEALQKAVKEKTITMRQKNIDAMREFKMLEEKSIDELVAIIEEAKSKTPDVPRETSDDTENRIVKTGDFDSLVEKVLAKIEERDGAPDLAELKEVVANAALVVSNCERSIERLAELIEKAENPEAPPAPVADEGEEHREIAAQILKAADEVSEMLKPKEGD